MKKHKYEMTLKTLRSSIALLDGEILTPLERFRQTLLLTSEKINEIKKEVLQNGFTSTDEEIYFFKFVKPAFYALQIYEVDIYNLATNVPPGTGEMQKVFYEQELLYLFRLFRTHAFHYQYFRTGARELDAQYFTREGRPGDIPVFPCRASLPRSTICSPNLSPLSACNLVELAYGIWLTGQVNHGNVSITEIISWLETQFKVKIGTAFRCWQSIARRKRLSQTKYLDQMRDAILKRLDGGNGV